MNDPQACNTMADLRVQIDRIDADLITLMARRATFIDRASVLKPAEGLPARIETRIEDVIVNVRDRATVDGLDPALAETIWRQLIEWSIAREETAMGKDRPQQETSLSATILDGKAFAVRLRARVSEQVAALHHSHGIKPGLAVVLAGTDPASEVYVRSKGKMTVESGMTSFEHRLANDVSQDSLLALIDKLNRDPEVHGILVQLPLPSHLDSNLVINAIDPAKDVDGFHISNVGRLGTGQKAMVPCTPLGCLMMLRAYHGDLAGMEAVVVGRSNIVGKPMAQLLLGDNCTVTLAHSRSRDLAAICRRADILVAAVGRPEMIPGDWVKPGATVIDVGINRIAEDNGKTRLVGDVHFDSAVKVAGAITPVPGGVGPMTIACLLANTLTAACRANGLPEPDGLTV